MKLSQVKDCIIDDKIWTLESKNGNTLVFIRTFGLKLNARLLHFTLTLEENGGFKIGYPAYEFHSTVAHLKSSEVDLRRSYNKNYISSVINTLKRVGVWAEITNKDFYQVNDWAPKSDKGKVRKKLAELLSV